MGGRTQAEGAMSAAPPAGRQWSWWFVGAAIAVLAWLNLTAGAPGSVAFEEQRFVEFEASRGWPFRWWTRGNDGGLQLVRDEVVQGGYCVPDARPGTAFPHLFVHPLFLALDVLVALAFLRLAFVCGRPARRQP